MSSTHADSFHGLITDPVARHAALQADLLAMGYDKSLDLIGGRSVVISMHSEEDLNCEAIRSDPDGKIFTDAMEQSYCCKGRIIRSENGYKLMRWAPGSERMMSFMLHNRTDDTVITFFLEVTSQGAIAHTGSLTSTMEVLPGECKVLNHIIKKPPPSSTSVGTRVVARKPYSGPPVAKKHGSLQQPATMI